MPLSYGPHHLQLRMGDVNLYTSDSNGPFFFKNIKIQLEYFLRDFNVHYHFISEAPSGWNLLAVHTG